MKINRFYIYAVIVLVWSITMSLLGIDKILLGINVIIMLLIYIIKELIKISDKHSSSFTLKIDGDENNISIHTEEEREIK